MSETTRTGSRFLDALLAEAEAVPDERDFTVRTTSSYLTGVYLAVNAIQDAFLLVEGPDCAYMKSQYVQGNHDWLSTLTSVSGFHRLSTTALHPAQMSDSREEPLRETMMRVASGPDTGGLLISSMPMAAITGADYERLCRDVNRETGRPVVHVQGLSLSGDWLDGYYETLKSLARQLALPEAEKGERKVAVVGYLFDRNEEDHHANVRELERMCTALDLELVSVWLSGQRFAELDKVAEAGTILSLPYGRRAARLVARRTGAELIELPLPFGLTATEQWMRTLGERFDRAEAAEAFIAANMQDIAPRLEWVIPFSFQGRSFGYVGDPHLLPGLKDTAELLGAALRLSIVTNNPSHGRKIEGADQLHKHIVSPTLRKFMRHLLTHIEEERLDVLVTNNMSMNLPLPDTAMIEFGFPALFQHALFERPFLGFRGFMAFVDTLANAVRQQELVRNRVRFVRGTMHR